MGWSTQAGGTGRAVWGCALPAAAVQMQVRCSAVENFRAECESVIQRWAGSSFPPALVGLEGCSTPQEVLLVCTDLDQVAGLSQKLVDPDRECGKRNCAGNGDPETAVRG